VMAAPREGDAYGRPPRRRCRVLCGESRPAGAAESFVGTAALGCPGERSSPQPFATSLCHPERLRIELARQAGVEGPCACIVGALASERPQEGVMLNGF